MVHIDFFELKSAADLFCKLEDDLAHMEAAGQDSRIAFNFFVTAEHLPDWLGQRALVRKYSFLRVVSHIANGAKHFELTNKRHKSVTNTEKLRVFEDEVFEPGVFDEPLIIELSPNEAQELGTAKIDAVSLGRKVVEFWRPYVPAS